MTKADVPRLEFGCERWTEKFFVNFLAERVIFRFYWRNVGEKKKFRDYPHFISGPGAVCTGPGLTIAEKSWIIRQVILSAIAHLVECRQRIARKYYLLDEGRNHYAKR
jgi:hypothetical protein